MPRAILKLFSASGYFFKPSCASPRSTQGRMSLRSSVVTFDIIASESANRFSAVALRAAMITAFRLSDSFLPAGVGSCAHAVEKPQNRIAEHRTEVIIQHPQKAG